MGVSFSSGALGKQADIALAGQTAVYVERKRNTIRRRGRRHTALESLPPRFNN